MRFTICAIVLTVCLIGINHNASAVPFALDVSDPVLILEGPQSAGELALLDDILSEPRFGGMAAQFVTTHLEPPQPIAEPSPAMLFLAGLIVFCAARLADSVVRRTRSAQHVDA